MSQNANDHCVKLQKSYVILFAFLEDVVLSHAHRLHDQLHSLQVDVAILCQVALQTNTVRPAFTKHYPRPGTLNDTKSVIILTPVLCTTSL